MDRPKLLDLFCGAGGAAMGYARAGFDVLGVDINPQPHYPFTFIQADAMTFPLDGYAAIHASPPCQDHMLSPQTGQRLHGTAWMLSATRERLAATGSPWVIENVDGAPMAAHVILCGTMFGLGTGGYELRRHRLFETSGLFALTPPCQHIRPALGVYGNGGGAGSARHGHKATAAQARQLMGISWMTGRELSQAIPPAYTEYLGSMLLEVCREPAHRGV